MPSGVSPPSGGDVDWRVRLRQTDFALEHEGQLRLRPYVGVRLLERQVFSSKSCWQGMGGRPTLFFEVPWETDAIRLKAWVRQRCLPLLEACLTAFQDDDGDHAEWMLRYETATDAVRAAIREAAAWAGSPYEEAVRRCREAFLAQDGRWAVLRDALLERQIELVLSPLGKTVLPPSGEPDASRYYLGWTHEDWYVLPFRLRALSGAPHTVAEGEGLLA
jgi:hypothetical protein